MIDIVHEVTGNTWDEVTEFSIEYFLNVLSYKKDKLDYEKIYRDKWSKKYKSR